MMEQRESELLSRLLQLAAEEDGISALNEELALDNNKLPQPWKCTSSASFAEVFAKLDALTLEKPSLLHLIKVARTCYLIHQQKPGNTALTPRTSLLIPGRGWYYLSDAPDPVTAKAISDTVINNTCASTGSSKITFCGDIHFKFEPKKPGIEYAIHALDCILFSDQAVTNPSLFIKLHLPNGIEKEVLATQTVYGKTVDKVVEESGESSLQFESAHFTQHCLLQLLTAPGDGKLDNFILSQEKLIGIDNEMAFEPEVVKGCGQRGHVTYIHTFLFFLPQMKEPLDQVIVEKFKALPVEKSFLLWLKALEARNALYDRLSRPNLKITFNEGTLKDTYTLFKEIQYFFRTSQVDAMTGEGLFKAARPKVFACYQAIQDKLQGQSLVDKMKALQKTKRGDQDALTFEALGLSVQPLDKVTLEEDLKKAEICRRMKKFKEAPLQEETPKEGMKNLMGWIDYASLSASEKEAFESEFRAGGFPVEKLVLNRPEVTGETLLTLSKNAISKNATLSHASLDNTQVNLDDVIKFLALPGCAGIELCLGENRYLGLKAWQYLLRSPLCDHFSLKLPGGEILILKSKEDQSIHSNLFSPNSSSSSSSLNLNLDLMPENYLSVLSQQFNQHPERESYLRAIEALLIQEGYPIKSFAACLAQQNNITARRFIVSNLRYLILMLEGRQSTSEQYLAYYLPLNKSWRLLFYQQILQEVKSRERLKSIQILLGEYPDSDGERRLSGVREQQFRQQLTALIDQEPTAIVSEEKVCLEGLTIGKACLNRTLTEHLITEGWLLEDNFNFARKKVKINEPEQSTIAKPITEESSDEALLMGTPIKKSAIEKLATQDPTKLIKLENQATMTSSVLHGNHLVIPISFQDSQVHLKVLPDFPGMEMAYHLLSKRIIGKGSPQVELWKWRYGAHTYPVLVSETILGENLTPELLRKFPLEQLSYQQHVLMAMLVNPGDGNPGNFLAQKVTASDGSIQLRLVSIDNDRLFAPPFEAGKLRTATLIYCFNEMQLPLHKDLRKQFLSLNAYEALSGLLTDLEKLNEQYRKIFTPKELEHFMSGDINQSSYLLTLLKRGWVSKLFFKFKIMQYWLGVEPNIALTDLLSKVQSSLANHYQQMRIQYDNPIRRFEEAVKNEYRREEIQGVKRYTSTMHMGQYLKMQGREVTEDKTVTRYWQQDSAQARKELKDLSVSRSAIELAKRQLLQGNSKDFADLPEAYAQEEVIANIHFQGDIRNAQGMPDAKQQQAIIQLILKSPGLKSLERLILQDCAITDEQLTHLIKRLPKLRVLKLMNCPHIKTAFYSTLFQLEKLEIKQLEECSLQGMTALIDVQFTSHTLKYFSIKEAPNLKTFSFYSDSLTQLRLSEAKQCNQFDIIAKELQEADFSGNSLLTDLHLQQIVLKCQNLKQMNLQGCDDKKIAYRALKEKLPIFAEKIDQSGEIEFESIAGELSLVAANEAEYLESGGRSFSSWLCKCFFLLLAENTSIKRISLEGCVIHGETMVYVAQALEKNQTVTEINLRNNFMCGEEGGVTIAQALEHNKAVISIDLDGNLIGNKGAAAVAKALGINDTIMRINLAGNNISEEGAALLANALKHNKTVKEIDLSFNSIGEEGAMAFAEALKINKVIEIRGISIDSDAKKRVEASLRWEWGVAHRMELCDEYSKAKIIIRDTAMHFFSDIVPVIVKGFNLSLGQDGIDTTANYTPSAFQLNPFTFFSEQADREGAISFAQIQHWELNILLKKYVKAWEMPKKDNASTCKELQKAARLFGFDCIPIAKDGNCLFEAVSQQFKVILSHEQEHHYSHSKLRELAVAYLMKHQDFYENFVEDHNFASFIRKMSIPGMWAEHTVLNALAHLLNVTIVVINSDNSDPIVLKKLNAKGIIYLGYEVDTHYQVLTHDLSILPEKSIKGFIERAPFLESPSKPRRAPALLPTMKPS